MRKHSLPPSDELNKRIAELLVPQGQIRLMQMLDWELENIQVYMPEHERPLIGFARAGSGWKDGDDPVIIIVDGKGAAVQGLPTEHSETALLYEGDFSSGKALASRISAPVNVADVESLGFSRYVKT